MLTSSLRSAAFAGKTGRLRQHKLHTPMCHQIRKLKSIVKDALPDWDIITQRNATPYTTESSPPIRVGSAVVRSRARRAAIRVLGFLTRICTPSTWSQFKIHHGRQRLVLQPFESRTRIALCLSGPGWRLRPAWQARLAAATHRCLIARCCPSARYNVIDQCVCWRIALP